MDGWADLFIIYLFLTMCILKSVVSATQNYLDLVFNSMTNSRRDWPQADVTTVFHETVK